MHAEDRLTVKEAALVLRILNMTGYQDKDALGARDKIERCLAKSRRKSDKAYLIGNTRGKRARPKLKLAGGRFMDGHDGGGHCG